MWDGVLWRWSPMAPPAAARIVAAAISVTLIGLAIAAPDTAAAHLAEARTSTAVTCSPAAIVIAQPARCIATVTDRSGHHQHRLKGSVRFHSAIKGSFTALRCAAAGKKLRCGATFVPSTAGLGKVTARFGGGRSSRTSSAHATISVGVRTITLTVACTPAKLTAGASTTCAATVADASPGSAAMLRTAAERRTRS
jgi:hypothetical protein